MDNQPTNQPTEDQSRILCKQCGQPILYAVQLGLFDGKPHKPRRIRCMNCLKQMAFPGRIFKLIFGG